MLTEKQNLAIGQYLSEQLTALLRDPIPGWKDGRWMSSVVEHIGKLADQKPAAIADRIRDIAATSSDPDTTDALDALATEASHPAASAEPVAWAYFPTSYKGEPIIKQFRSRGLEDGYREVPLGPITPAASAKPDWGAIVATHENLASIAASLHYPDCWDTACYPTLGDALTEVAGNEGCCMCKPAAPKPAASAEPACQTCGGTGMIGGHRGQTPEQYEEWSELCPECSASEVGIQTPEPVAWSLDSDAAKFLADTIMAGDEPTEVTLSVGYIKDDDGTIKYGLRMQETEYPEEGASLLVECATPAPQPAASAELEAEVATARRTAEYWKAEHLAGNTEIERLRNALSRLLTSDPTGAIVNAADDELRFAVNDERADPVVREQAAALLQARAALAGKEAQS